MPTPITIEQLLGPVGLTVGLIVAVIAFAFEVVTPGKRTRRAEAIAEKALDRIGELVSTVDQMAGALEHRNRIDEEALRRVQHGGTEDRPT